MCGIAGYFSRMPVAPETGAAMLAELRRRGPDAEHVVGWDAGFARSDGVHHNALLHARLSIIDPRPVSDQPMGNDAGDIWICYNGEVYDWAADAALLRARGAVFHTRSDTEFILRAYEAWGIDCVARLTGMFAFAILDLRSQTLWLARDRMGEKPMVYSQVGDNFAFGSTVRAVLPFVPRERRGFDGAAIDAYLAHRYIPAPGTVFESIQRLPNAHTLRFDLKTRQISTQRYWTPQARPDDWRARLDAAVEMRTVADRPLGLFLSSGIDSSVIACRLAAAGHNHLQTFTAGFPGSSMDEGPAAAEIAGVLGFPNLAVPIPARIADDFERIVADLDEPFADPSSMPTWYLARATTRHVKVVLGGDGGDELLAGYKRIAKHLRTRWRHGLVWPGLRLQADLDARGWRKLSQELRLDWATAYSLRFSGFAPGQRLALQPDRPFTRAAYWRMPEPAAADPLQQLLDIDRDNYLPEYILRKADLCTMAHGLEMRAPLLDHHWIEALAALPAAQRFTRPAKLMLAEAMPQLAALKLFERKKRGFNPPLSAWLHDDLAARLDGLGTRLAAVSGAQLDATAVDTLVARYRAGQSGLAEQVLQLLLLETSLRQLRALQ